MIIDYPTFKQRHGLYALWREAFGDGDAFLDTFFNTAFGQNRCRCATQNGEVIGALYWFGCFLNGQKLAYIYAVATKKSHRGKGVCAALMDDTHGLLKGEGYSGAVLVPGSQELFRFYEKMNYKTCCFNETFSCIAGERETTIREIDEIEFACLRRQFLPNGGIIQENENIAFLKTMASFYVGEDFLLTARKEKDTLNCLEFLGNRQSAEGILAALNCKEGIFRTNGKEKPFGMFLPLANDAETPSYLGFAFD